MGEMSGGMARTGNASESLAALNAVRAGLTDNILLTFLLTFGQWFSTSPTHLGSGLFQGWVDCDSSIENEAVAIPMMTPDLFEVS